MLGCNFLQSVYLYLKVNQSIWSSKATFPMTFADLLVHLVFGTSVPIYEVRDMCPTAYTSAFVSCFNILLFQIWGNTVEHYVTWPDTQVGGVRGKIQTQADRLKSLCFQLHHASLHMVSIQTCFLLFDFLYCSPQTSGIISLEIEKNSLLHMLCIFAIILINVSSPNGWFYLLTR